MLLRSSLVSLRCEALSASPDFVGLSKSSRRIFGYACELFARPPRLSRISRFSLVNILMNSLVQAISGLRDLSAGWLRQNDTLPAIWWEGLGTGHPKTRIRFRLVERLHHSLVAPSPSQSRSFRRTGPKYCGRVKWPVEGWETR